LVCKCYVCSLKMINSMEVKKKPTRGMPPITFIDKDFGNIEQCLNDPEVVKVKVANFLGHKVLLNNGSSTDVLCSSAFQQ